MCVRVCKSPNSNNHLLTPNPQFSITTMVEIHDGDDPVGVFMTLDGWPIPPPPQPDHSDADSNEPTNDDDDDSSGNLSQSSETLMLGFIIVNIVGLQHYPGTISGRELVGFVREPLNQYDSNAIKVLNTRSLQVGHIEKAAAKVLAPLIDGNLIVVEGIVPNSPGRGVRYKVPCQVHIFARIEAFGRVKAVIFRGGLNLISENDVSFGLSDSLVVKEKNEGEDGKSVDEIFKLVEENVSKKGAMGLMEPPKDVIKTELFLHQKEGLNWLVHREKSCELPPFWEEKKDGSFVNVLTNHQTPNRPDPIRGGIFADDMGLGKTLTLLSLIALDKYDEANVEELEEEGDGENEVVSGVSKSKRGKGSKTSGNNSRKKLKTEDSGQETGVLKTKTTLVVCPPSVFSSWITQLGEHTRSGRLKVYMYYGERTQDAMELQKYDIVLTTYSILAHEQRSTWSPISPIKNIEWWRVILDEAHIIKNSSAQQSRAVSRLSAKRRWVVTGTPIQNGSMDLFSLMSFLRFEPFSIKSYWTNLVQRPLSQGSEKGLSRLQVLMATMSLRRTKDKTLVGLPPKGIETCFVDLSTEEREVYDQMESQAKSLVLDYISAHSVMTNYTTVLSIILRLRQICTNLALCPPDLRESLPSNNIEDVSNNPELLKKLISVVQGGEDFDCPICISSPTDIVITCCAHIFCRSCILKTLKRTKACCPMCRHPLSESDLFYSPPEEIDNSSSSSFSGTSSKVSALLKLLSAARDQNPKIKSVIFSQFRKMLMFLEEPLKAAGYKILRLDGSMNAKRRANVIKEFGVPAPDGPTILLASLKASGTGINLTAASRVYLMEPWWNPAAEEQAMDRVHRIGQKEDVKIVRMIARNSIDERILELQEKKKKLARDAFSRKATSKERKEMNIDDLRTLMSL